MFSWIKENSWLALGSFFLAFLLVCFLSFFLILNIKGSQGFGSWRLRFAWREMSEDEIAWTPRISHLEEVQDEKGREYYRLALAGNLVEYKREIGRFTVRIDEDRHVKGRIGEEAQVFWLVGAIPAFGKTLMIWYQEKGNESLATLKEGELVLLDGGTLTKPFAPAPQVDLAPGVLLEEADEGVKKEPVYFVQVVTRRAW